MGEWTPTFLTSDALARRIAKEIDPGGDLDDWERVIAKYLLQWQQIETAPRDGRQVLGWLAGKPAVVEWCPQRFHWYLTGIVNLRLDIDEELTHWMPLPAPPTTGDDR